MKPVSMRLATTVGAIMALVSGTILAQAEPPLAVGDGMKVTVEYTATPIETTGAKQHVVKENTTYTQGNREIIPSLESAITGMKAGEKKRVTLAPDKAYGHYDEAKINTVGKDLAPADAKVGSAIPAPNGTVARIVAIKDNKVTIDTNHPLAGKTVVFDLNVLKVEKAKAKK